jgi:hypothetical protein
MTGKSSASLTEIEWVKLSIDRYQTRLVETGVLDQLIWQPWRGFYAPISP